MSTPFPPDPQDPHPLHAGPWPALQRRWRELSMTLKITLLLAVTSCVGTLGAGVSLYDATRDALSTRADYQLIARVEHMRTLLHDLYTVQQLEARPALFETMLGDEQDVIIFRRLSPAAGAAPEAVANAPGASQAQPMQPFIQVNPQHLTPPPFAPVPASQPVTLKALFDGKRADGLRMRWVAARAMIGPRGQSGDTIEIIAAHVMTQEEKVLQHYRTRIVWTIGFAVLITALLGALALRASLRPLRAMASRAADITPSQLQTRFNTDDAPSELKQFADSFNAMLDRIASGYHRLVQFSADLAHELRTPVGVLIGQTQVTLVHPRTAQEYRQVLESNLEELERIGRIAQNMLFLAQADHERQTPERSTLALDSLLSTICEYFEGLAEERQLHFTFSASGHIHAHPEMLRRAISNVVVNAVRYADPETAITVLGKEDAQGACIVIGNQGKPIPPETIPLLFDRFYRGDVSRSEFTESSGLGLAIVRAIMTLHDGRVEMHCSDSGWIEVSLFFPSGLKASSNLSLSVSQKSC